VVTGQKLASGRWEVNDLPEQNHKGGRYEVPRGVAAHGFDSHLVPKGMELQVTDISNKSRLASTQRSVQVYFSDAEREHACINLSGLGSSCGLVQPRFVKNY
jgi:hypothetical protein